MFICYGCVDEKCFNNFSFLHSKAYSVFFLLMESVQCEAVFSVFLIYPSSKTSHSHQVCDLVRFATSFLRYYFWEQCWISCQFRNWAIPRLLQKQEHQSSQISSSHALVKYLDVHRSMKKGGVFHYIDRCEIQCIWRYIKQVLSEDNFTLNTLHSSFNTTITARRIHPCES